MNLTKRFLKFAASVGAAGVLAGCVDPGPIMPPCAYAYPPAPGYDCNGVPLGPNPWARAPWTNRAPDYFPHNYTPNPVYGHVGPGGVIYNGPPPQDGRYVNNQSVTVEVDPSLRQPQQNYYESTPPAPTPRSYNPPPAGSRIPVPLAPAPAN